MNVICPDCKKENTEDSKFCKTCGASLKPGDISSSITKTMAGPQVPPAEEKLIADRYRILSTLGKGGMGEVYKVRDIKLQEDMALKLLRPEIANDPDVIQRFRNELKLARKITHINVCRVFDFHEEGGIPFITMEYVQGDNLKSLIKGKGKFGEEVAIGIAIQITEGLVVAHDLGVIHRDLKPQNIMIEPDGRAKVMDFGIARSIIASGLTQTGQMIGTPDYLSSEQAAGQPADHRADIYALGVMLYEMTTGQLPFKGDTALSVITKHREKAAEDPRTINPAASEGLSRLILRCMEKDKELRYQNARELLEDLRGLSKGTVPKSVPEKTSKSRFFGRKRAAIVSAAALVLIAGIVIFWQIQERSPSPSAMPERPSLGVVYFENNSGDQSLDHWRKGFAELLTSDLSQSKYLNILTGDRIYEILDDLDLLGATGYSSDSLKQVARKGNVKHILRGSYIKAGPKFRVSIALQNMESGEVVGSHTIEAEGEENLFALVDDLTKKIKSDMNLTSEQIADDFDAAAAEVMTASPEAYAFYVEGLRYHYRAEYKQCIEYMDKAIAIDPEFAAAYGWKAFAYESWGYYAEFVTAMKKTYELIHRLKGRERYRYTAYYYYRIENDIPKAMAELREYIRLYPEDIFAHHQLGYLYFLAFDDYEKCVEYLRFNIDNRIKMFYSYYAAAWAEMCLGKYEKAREVCELYIGEIGDHPEMRFSLSVYYLIRGDYDRAQAEINRAEELGFVTTFWNDLLKGCIDQAKGDLGGAEGHYRNMAETRDALISITGREYLGVLAVLQGRFHEAASQFKQAIDLVEATGDVANLSRLYSHLAYAGLRAEEYEETLRACDKAAEYGDRSMDPFNATKLALHLKGLSQLALGNSAAALETAEELKKASERDPSRLTMRSYLHLMGSIEMKEGNTGNAIKYFEEAASLLPGQNQNDLAGFKNGLRRTLYRTSLAEAYFQAGNMEKAKQACETLTGLTIGRTHYGDLYVKAFYWLGRISEEQGKTDEAASHYRKFLELWKNADPDSPELADAKARLDSLA
jgi:serine/threonine protein kinase/tetratricopeptide (TPR) repeat protein